MRGREFIALISVPLSRGGMRTLVDIGTLQFSRRSPTDYSQSTAGCRRRSGAAYYPAGLTPSGVNASRAQCA